MIKLKIKLTPLQKVVDQNPSRYKFLKWGRRTGKTMFMAYWTAKQALMRKGKHWHVTKTLNLGREEFFPALLDLLPRDLIARVDHRLLNAWLTNGSVVSVKSGEKEDNLRGRGLHSVGIDEADFLKERLYEMILRPQLAVSQGPILAASSPRKGWFTRAFNKSAKEQDADSFASYATIYDNPFVPREEIEEIKARTTDSTWRQEYMAEELANVGQVYEEFHSGIVFNPRELYEDVRDFQCVRGVDWGKEAKTGVSWIGISPEGHLVVFDEHSKNKWDVDKHAEVMNSKSIGLKIAANVLDRSAFRDVGTGVSIAELFRKHGINCQESFKDISASIDAVKRFMRGDGVTPWLRISSNCPQTIEALQDWQHGDHEPDIAAAMRYAVSWAVFKRMTRLADASVTRKPTDPLAAISDPLLLALHAQIRRRSKPAQWGWDYSSGGAI